MTRTETAGRGPATTTEPPPAPILRADRRHRASVWRHLKIQSKLLAMLLAVSIVSIVVAGFFGYRSGSRALESSAYNQLAAVLDGRSQQIDTYFTGLRRSVIVNSLNLTTIQAVREFSTAFGQLSSERISPADTKKIGNYYSTQFVPQLRRNVEGEVSADSFEPRTVPQQYLQAAYTATTKSYADKIKVDDARDGSTWSAVHRKYHDFFREVVLQNGFEDLMLLDAEGNTIYTAYKGVDLGTNLLTGPYKESALEAAYQSVLRTNAVNSVSLTDFEPYTPSYDVPTAFALSPVGVDGKLAGVLAVQLPVDGINTVMTSGEQWRENGLGSTGETLLVGPDQTLRSTSRLLTEDPDAYRREVVAAGTPPEVADRVVALDNPILLQRVNSDSVRRALQGQSGTVVEQDYLGRTVLSSYRPLDQEGTNWAIVAHIDQNEALAPVRRLLRTLGLSTVAMVILVTLASIVLSRAFSRPVSQLLSGVRAVASGDLDARVRLRTRDEFNDLAHAFNDMSANLRSKQDLLDAEMAENDRMLRTLMPETVAQRYRGGERDIVEEHLDVSVLFASLDGFEDFTAGRPPQESISLLNELVGSFDAAAEKTGVEKVRTLRSGYIASCGLAVPRIDHAVRIVSFAREMTETVDRFRAQHGADIRLRIGIDTGTVTSGLVGGAAAYDLWGESVNLAYAVQSAINEPGVFLSKNVYDKVRDAYELSERGTITVKRVEQPVWELKDAGLDG